MKWTVGISIAFVAAALAAPSNRPGPTETSGSTNMSEESNLPSDPITIDTTTQNIFDDVISVTPPDAESIELQHMSDDTRFYPDYGDTNPVAKDHFTDPPNPEGPPRDSRKKRSVDSEYNYLDEEMYLDSAYTRKRRDVGEDPLRIDLEIPDDSDSSEYSHSVSDVQTTRSPVSDPDSISTQITYVIISEDSSSDEAVNNVRNFSTEPDERTTEVIDLVMPSSEPGIDNTDSSSSTDSVAERNQILRAIASTIRNKRSPNHRRRRSSEETDMSSSSEAQLFSSKARQIPYYRLPDINYYRIGRSVSEPSVDADVSSSSEAQSPSRKSRQIPYYRLPDINNYRIGRSVSEPDSDDTEPEDAHGLNMKDLSMDGTDLKLLDGVAKLPEYSDEFSELTRPSSTYVDGKLQSYYMRSDESGRTSNIEKRSVSSEDSPPTTESETEAIPEVTTQNIDVVTATYPLGIDATKNNLSLPEGIFLGPRIYAKGDLLQEEQPAATERAEPMDKEETVPILNGSESETVNSAPFENINIPLIIPVIAPTSHPGEEPRIELSVPSGYVPYLVQIPLMKNESTTQNTTESTFKNETMSESVTPTASKPEVPTYLPYVPTIIITPSTPTPTMETETTLPTSEVPQSMPTTETSQNLVNNVSSSVIPNIYANIEPFKATTSLPNKFLTPQSTEQHGYFTAQTERIPPVLNETLAPNLTSEQSITSKQKRAEWKPISQAPEGETEIQTQPKPRWQASSDAPTSEVENVSQGSPSRWEQVPVGEVELPRQQNPKWVSASEAPIGEVEVTTQNQTTKSEPELNNPSIAVESSTVEAENRNIVSGELPTTPQQRLSTSDMPQSASSSVANVPIQSENEQTPSEKNGTQPVSVSSRTSQGTPSQNDFEMADEPNPRTSFPGWKRTRTGKHSEVIPILEKNSVMNSNGSFSYSFKSGNGIQVQESGYLKKEAAEKGSAEGGVAQAVQGSYSYTSPDGRVISVRYVADERGFRPEVEDLPK